MMILWNDGRNSERFIIALRGRRGTRSIMMMMRTARIMRSRRLDTITPLTNEYCVFAGFDLNSELRRLSLRY